MKTIPVEEYEPFGEEWKKEVTKMNKKMLVDLLRNTLINLQDFKYKSPEEKTLKNKVNDLEKIILPHQELTQWIEEQISDENNNVIEPSHDFINMLFEKVHKINH